MPFEERRTWAYLATALIVPAGYLLVLVTGLGGLSASPAEGGFQVPLLVAVGTGIVANMFFVRPPRKGRDRRDERDAEIGRRGERVGFIVLGAAMIVPFALVMAEAAYFWTAHAMYLAYVASAVVSSAVKLVLYRRGL
ncbi:hypothetical protein O4J56_13480 [Nocardiopsis sp. RSe5-2]|uniref:Uncharacterized protein n=1 Tax=Nocardiopsis endophytica TaxID=3018445 RepID=A0ABT4U5N1_9ACTN|nr:hypothetical protein [Nocardiopsis endophytica]MDA2811647.1 hypothetical protein [Nocardiopsis endophytica]